MRRAENLIELKTETGNPLYVGDCKLTPQSQALIIGGSSGGMVWNRPVALLVEQDGELKRFPILDLTRIIQLGLICSGLIFSIFSLGILFRRKEK